MENENNSLRALFLSFKRMNDAEAPNDFGNDFMIIFSFSICFDQTLTKIRNIGMD